MFCINNGENGLQPLHYDCMTGNNVRLIFHNLLHFILHIVCIVFLLFRVNVNDYYNDVKNVLINLPYVTHCRIPAVNAVYPWLLLTALNLKLLLQSVLFSRFLVKMVSLKIYLLPPWTNLPKMYCKVRNITFFRDRFHSYGLTKKRL